MKKYLTESIGTFFLVLTFGLAVSSGTAVAPIAIGCALMVMVYMGGHVSGAHYNPAVSTAMLLRGELSSSDYGPYVIAQLIGSLLAGLVTFIATGATVAPAPGAEASTIAALLVEILFTFALVLVIFNVAVSKGTKGNSFYGLAIGFTVLAGAFAGGPISGGAFNPAVGVGMVLVDVVLGGGSIAPIWLYIVGPIVGGILAMYVFKFQED